MVDEWNWPRAGLLAALFLLAFFPVLWSAAGLAFALVYLLLPVYLIHEFEEHHDDGFRRFFNDHLADGREMLTRPGAFWTNAVAIWMLFAAAILVAYYVDIGIGLIVVAVVLSNATVHVVGVLAWGGYNPGLTTALLLFVPLGVWATLEIGAAGDIGVGWYVIAFALGVAVHVAIVVSLKLRQGQ